MSWAEQDGTRCHHTTQNGTQFKMYEPQKVKREGGGNGGILYLGTFPSFHISI